MKKAVKIKQFNQGRYRYVVQREKIAIYDAWNMSKTPIGFLPNQNDDSLNQRAVAKHFEEK